MDRDGGAAAGAEDELTDSLVQTAFMTVAILGRLASENDLSLTQLRVLGILRDRRLRMSTLADYLGLEKSTLTGLVDRAAKRGLIERVAGATDGRSVEVHLSPAGLQLATHVHQQSRDALSNVIARIPADERTHLHSMLEEMQQAVPSPLSL